VLPVVLSAWLTYDDAARGEFYAISPFRLDQLALWILAPVAISPSIAGHPERWRSSSPD